MNSTEKRRRKRREKAREEDEEEGKKEREKDAASASVPLAKCKADPVPRGTRPHPPLINYDYQNGKCECRSPREEKPAIQPSAMSIATTDME